MKLDRPTEGALNSILEGRKFHPWKPSLRHGEASQRLIKAVEEFGERVSQKAIHDLAVTGSVSQAPVKRTEAENRLARTHQYMDRIRANIEDAYNEGETDPSIILANIESILSAANQDNIR